MVGIESKLFDVTVIDRYSKRDCVGGRIKYLVEVKIDGPDPNTPTAVGELGYGEWCHAPPGQTFRAPLFSVEGDNSDRWYLYREDANRRRTELSKKVYK